MTSSSLAGIRDHLLSPRSSYRETLGDDQLLAILLGAADVRRGETALDLARRLKDKLVAGESGLAMVEQNRFAVAPEINSFSLAIIKRYFRYA